MNDEDQIDEQFNNKRIIRRKNIVMILMLMIVFLFFCISIYQKQADKIDCDNRIMYERSTICGIPVYIPELGAIVYPNYPNMTVNKSKFYPNYPNMTINKSK